MYWGQLCLSNRWYLFYFIHKSCTRSVRRYCFVRNYAAVPVQLEVVVLQYIRWCVLIIIIIIIIVSSDQKYLENFEMWCWRRMISWADRVRNEEVLLRVNEQRNILHEIRKRKANWIGHILSRNCLLKQVIEGKIKGEMEVARR